MTYPSLAQLRLIAPRGTDEILTAVAEGLATHGGSYGLESGLRIAHFLAQAAHETDGFRVTTEYASGAAYEGRLDLGNTQEGDGVLFKGRGIFMLTGRANYEKFGQAIDKDLVSEPGLAADPAVSTLIALHYWNSRGLNSLADANDFIGITRKINGGVNGFADRKHYFLAACETLNASGEADALRDLWGPGDRGDDVRNLQAMLNRKLGNTLDEDGIYGRGTVGAVRQAENHFGQPVDGIADPEFRKVLSQLPEPVPGAESADTFFMM